MMILYAAAEAIFITVSVIIILGGLVYLLHKPSKGDTSKSDDTESGDPHI